MQALSRALEKPARFNKWLSSPPPCLALSLSLSFFPLPHSVSLGSGRDRLTGRCATRRRRRRRRCRHQAGARTMTAAWLTCMRVGGAWRAAAKFARRHYQPARSRGARPATSARRATSSRGARNQHRSVFARWRSARPAKWACAPPDPAWGHLLAAGAATGAGDAERGT